MGGNDDRHLRSAGSGLATACLLILGGVLVYATYLVFTPVHDCFPPPRRAHGGARDLAHAVELYWLEHPRECPSVPALREAGVVRLSTRGKDPWDNPFHISCDGDDITVRSAGPDGEFGSEDDITNHRSPYDSRPRS